MEDPADLKFSVRPDVRPQRKSSSRSTFHWWLLLALGALVFLLVRGMLARGAETAGHSEDASLVTQLAPSSEALVDEIRVDPTPTVYKCVGKGGAVSFQSFPCAADESTRAAYDAQPDTQRDIEIAQAKRDVAVRRAKVMSRIAGTDRPTYTVASSSNFDADRARCEAAKAHREDTLRRVGLRRTYDLLQRLDEMVREACKGQ
ncbi:hypothetical protein [Noviluteimonas gilva]|uniref:DUF4124 domain-containing protein n=1 Tax=Noviluteimonas gilva TaxID=2682097 RepID=A0A7C9LHV4_9GAMM|nr:hypothetical protein [Lysobacter gilvus]MUV14380.1 hypothetical protein [Lysobacter gilvus]